MIMINLYISKSLIILNFLAIILLKTRIYNINYEAREFNEKDINVAPNSCGYLPTKTYILKPTALKSITNQLQKHLSWQHGWEIKDCEKIPRQNICLETNSALVLYEFRINTKLILLIVLSLLDRLAIKLRLRSLVIAW